MQALVDSRSSGNGTSYIHWNPEHSPYAIELKPKLIDRLILETVKAKQLGIEAGGLLIGSFPKAPVPTLQIDDFVVISRRGEDGALFTLTADQEQRFSSAKLEATTRERSPVGFFRSHLREEQIALSDEDKRLATEQFKQAIHVILVVGTTVPRRGSLFLSVGGEVLAEPVARDFPFDSQQLEALTRVHPSIALAPEPSPEWDHTGDAPDYGPPDYYYPTQRPKKRRWIIPIAIVLMLLCLIAGALLRPLLPGKLLEQVALVSPNHLDLTVTNADQVLKISWNHNLPELYRAKYGILIISDGGIQREVQLSGDDLRVGVVAYRRLSDHVRFTFVLVMRDFTSINQAASWQAR